MKRILLATALLCLASVSHAAVDRHSYWGPEIKQQKQVRYVAKAKKHRYAYKERRYGKSVARRDRGVYRSARASAVRSTPSNSTILAIAKAYVGTNPTGGRSLWCADFMNYVLHRAGYNGTRSRLARSFLANPRTTLHVGAIAVMSRGKRGGHVGIVSGFDRRGRPLILGGNQGRGGVREIPLKTHRVIAYVLPA